MMLMGNANNQMDIGRKEAEVISRSELIGSEIQRNCDCNHKRKTSAFREKF